MAGYELPAKSGAVRAICEPRWVGWTVKKPDPCDGCALHKPCVVDGYFPSTLSLDKMIAHRYHVNAAAEALTEVPE